MTFVRVLLVEDDEFKASEISNFLDSAIPTLKLHLVGDVASAIESIAIEVYDLIVLDIALPSHKLRAGRGPTSSLLSGGLEVLYELESLNRADSVVLVTQYPEVEIDSTYISLKSLEKNTDSYFSANVIGCVLFESGKIEWIEKMQSIIRGVKP